jgi:hypothetical protein
MGSTAPCTTDPKINSQGISMFARHGEPVEFFVQSSKWSKSFQSVVSPPGQITTGHKIYSSRDCLIPSTIPWTGIDKLEMRLSQLNNSQPPVFVLEKASEKIGEKPEIQLLRFKMTKRLGLDSLLITQIMPLQRGTYTLSMPKTNFKFEFRVLSGDADHSYNVDQQDVLLANQFIGPTSMKNGRFDIDGNGSIDIEDINLIRARLGQNVAKPNVREDFKVHLSDTNGKFVSGVIYASINGQMVTKIELNGKDLGITSVSGPVNTKIVWSNNLNSDVFETILDGKVDYDARGGNYVEFKVPVKPESGDCGHFFGASVKSFPSTREECSLKQENIDTTCKNFSGQAYKVNWTRFNADRKVTEVVNLQNGVCQTLPVQPPAPSDNPNSPDLACGTEQSVEDRNAIFSWNSQLRPGEELGMILNLRKYTNTNVNALYFDKSTLNFVCQLNGFLGSSGGTVGPFASPGNLIFLWNPIERRLIPAPRGAIGNPTIKGFSCKGKLKAQCIGDKSWIFKR